MQERARKAITILLIDQDEALLESAGQSLREEGFRVLTRAHATGCVSVILSEKPDLVLLDVTMRRLSEDALAAVFTWQAQRYSTKLLIHSDLPEHVLEVKARQLGAQGYIKKTDNARELVREVRHCLGVLAAPGQVSVGSVSIPPAVGSSTTLRIEPTRALFVDDDPSTLNAYRRLDFPEVRAEFVDSGRSAWRRIQSPEALEVVVCDVLMPDVSGIAVYEMAVARDPRWEARFVFVTGAGSISYVAEFLATLTCRVLEKPIDSTRLRHAIRYTALATRISEAEAKAQHGG